MLPNSTRKYSGTWMHVLCISLSEVILNSCTVYFSERRDSKLILRG